MQNNPIRLRGINSSTQSYQQLINLHQAIKNFVFSDITIQLEDWFAANMSAALGSILDKLASMNDIIIQSSKESIISILQKNGFLAHFGYDKLYDSYFTTIPYLKLKRQESRFFQRYVISNDGFCQIDADSETASLLTGPFPGTIINMQFRTDDTSSCSLAGEADYDTIF